VQAASTAAKQTKQDAPASKFQNNRDEFDDDAHADDARFAERMKQSSKTKMRFDGDRKESLKGLSKRERRELRKQWREQERSARDDER
jgi:hypothetical protein